MAKNKKPKWHKPCRVTAVRCPNEECSIPHNLSEFDYVLGEGHGVEQSTTSNPIFSCEHKDANGREIGCGQKFEVVKTEVVKLVWVRPTDKEGSFPGDTRG